MPARAAFWAVSNAADASAEHVNTRPKSQWLRDHLDALQLLLATSARSDVAKLMNSLSRLFLIAARCPRPTSYKGRSANASWLEAVFSTLLDVARISTVPNHTASLRHDQLAMLQDMLQIALDRKISLSLDYLQAIIICHGEYESEPEWSLLGKVVKLDADVFILPIVAVKKPKRYVEPEPERRLVEELFQGMTTAACRPGREISKEQRHIQQDVLLPMMHALAKARKLKTFFQLWQQSLETICQRRVFLGEGSERSPIPVVTFLESDEVFETVRNLLEKHLTSMQIAEEVETLIAQLKSSDGMDGWARASPTLMELDAIFSGLARDETIEKLYDHAVQVVDTLWPRLPQSWTDHVNASVAWRLLRRSCTIWPAITRAYPGFATYSPNSAFQLLTGFEQHLNEPSYYLSAYECLQSQFSIINAASGSSGDGRMIEAVDDLDKAVQVLAFVLEKTTRSSEDGEQNQDPDLGGPTVLFRWNGDHNSLTWMNRLAVALAATLISQYPSVLR